MKENFPRAAAPEDCHFGKDLAASPHQLVDPRHRNLDLNQTPLAAVARREDMLVVARPVDPGVEYLTNPRAPHPANMLDSGPAAAVSTPMASTRANIQDLGVEKWEK